MPLLKNGAIMPDPWIALSDEAPIPGDGPILISWARWQSEASALSGRPAPIGIRLRNNEAAEALRPHIGRFDLVALEFPKFRDGRAYSYARLLRERYGFKGELRAVGEVLLEQLFFMLRTGFDAFELQSDDPLRDYRTAVGEFSVWYQPAADGRPTAMQLRHGKR